MTAQKPKKYLTQNLARLLSAKQRTKTIFAGLLVVQILLISIHANYRIQQGDSVIEILIWMLNQCFPVLKQAKTLEEKSQKRDDKNDQ
ncbi:MAG TPA: hypothetical protein VK203_13825 [Nostocaceae cyanobacterium]|nr:hypothetical protein [Nostocaceae cyanobacterium]